MNETQSNVFNLNCSEFQNESDKFVANKFHRVINVEQDDIISITSHPIENESDHPLIFINLNSSEINIEFDYTHSYTLQDLTEIEFCDINSFTMDLNKNKPEKPNLNIQMCNSEIEVGSNVINDNIHQDFNKFKHGKNLISSDFNGMRLKKEPKKPFKHERLHFGDKLYECNKCMKTFFDSITLTRHSRTHDNYKNLNMTNKTPLQKINISHVGDTPYKCITCYKVFFDSLSLTRHIRFHCNK